MTSSELESSLPNGFHDAALKSLTVDYEHRRVLMTFSLKVGDPDGPREHRDDCRDAQVEIAGMIFWVVDPPDPTRDFSTGGEIWIADSYETTSILQFTQHLNDLLKAMPKGAFAHSFFVSDWNSYIHVAAMDCSVKWIGEQYSLSGRRKAYLPGETIDQ